MFSKPLLSISRSSLIRGVAGFVALVLVTSLLWSQIRPSPNSDPVEPTEPSGGSVLQRYSVQPDLLNVVVGLFRQRYAAENGVRISADPETSQVLVLAPPAVQKDAANLLNAIVGQSAAQTQAPEPPGGAGNQPARPKALTNHVYQLHKITCHELEAELQQLWGDKIPVTARLDSQWVTITLPHASGEQTVLRVDRHRGRVTAEGPAHLAGAWIRFIRTLDDAKSRPGEKTRLIPVRHVNSAKARLALVALEGNAQPDAQGLAAAQPDAQGLAAGSTRPGDKPPAPGTVPADAGRQPAGDSQPDTGGGFIGPVKTEFLEALDVIVVRGHERDVERVIQIINEIERLSDETEPIVKVWPLKHVNSQAISEILIQLYERVLSSRQGRLSITPLVKPNALLLIGRDRDIATTISLIDDLSESRAQVSTEFGGVDVLLAIVGEA